MNGIVEHVAKAIEDELSVDLYAREIALKVTPFAIKATLEYLSENVKGRHENAPEKQTDEIMNCFACATIENIEDGIQVYLSQALKELDQPKGDK